MVLKDAREMSIRRNEQPQLPLTPHDLSGLGWLWFQAYRDMKDNSGQDLCNSWSRMNSREKRFQHDKWCLCFLLNKWKYTPLRVTSHGLLTVFGSRVWVLDVVHKRIIVHPRHATWLSVYQAIHRSSLVIEFFRTRKARRTSISLIVSRSH